MKPEIFFLVFVVFLIGVMAGIILQVKIANDPDPAIWGPNLPVTLLCGVVAAWLVPLNSKISQRFGETAAFLGTVFLLIGAMADVVFSLTSQWGLEWAGSFLLPGITLGVAGYTLGIALFLMKRGTSKA